LSTGEDGVGIAKGQDSREQEAEEQGGSDDADQQDNGCDSHRPEECYRLAKQLSKGEDVSKRKLKRAAALFEKSCAGEVMEACTGLGLIYQSGNANEQKRAVELFEKACDGGDMDGCNQAGLAYRYGKGTTRKRARAVGLFEQACRGGHERGCLNKKRMKWAVAATTEKGKPKSKSKSTGDSNMSFKQLRRLMKKKNGAGAQAK
jgi:TPR repeat protein